MKHLLLALLVGSLSMACQNKDKSKDDKNPSAKPSPAATTAPAKTPPTTAAAPAATAKPAATSGANQWWCYTMDDLGECHTTLELCKVKLKAEAQVLLKRGLNPIALSACNPQPDAVCFTYNKASYKAPKAKCNRDAKSCKAMYDIYTKQWPDLAMTKCEKAGAWQSGKPPAAPAPAK